MSAKPASKSKASEPSSKHITADTSGAVQIVWQWLTYGLWVLTLGGLGFLLTSTLSYFITNGGSYTSGQENIVYVIAITLCLFPAAYFIDKAYSKHEPAEKHAFAAVVMVLHAVLAFLVGIVALIVAVVTLLSLATDITGDAKSKATIILSSLLIAFLSAIFFVRIVRPAHFAALSKRFGLLVAGITAVTIAAALVGPFTASIINRSDRLIEANLPGLSVSVQNYATSNQKLPASLSDLTFNPQYEKGAKALVDRNLVMYRILKSPTTPLTAEDLSVMGNNARNNVSYSDTKSGVSYPYNPGGKTLAFELCVTYKNAKIGNPNMAVPQMDSGTLATKGYIDTYSHKAGEVCYEQYAYINPTEPAQPAALDKTQ